MEQVCEVTTTSLPAIRVSHEALALQRKIAFWVVLIPFLALLVGVALMARSAVGRI